MDKGDCRKLKCLSSKRKSEETATEEKSSAEFHPTEDEYLEHIKTTK